MTNRVGHHGSTRFGWTWIGRSLRLRQRQVAAVLLLATAAYAAGLVFPIATQRVVDEIVSGQAGLGVAVWALVGIAAIGVEAVVVSLRQKYIVELGAFLDRRISRRVFAHLLRVRTDGAQFRSGEIVNHFQQVTKIRDFALNQVPHVILDAGGALVALGLAFAYDWVVGCALVGLLPLLAVLAGNRIGAAREVAERFYAALGTRQNSLSETVNGLATVKALALEVPRLRRWEIVTEAMLRELCAILDISRSYILRAQVASRGIALLVIGLGCWRLYGGHLTVGELLALQLISSRITGPILASGDLHRAWQEVAAAIRQVDGFLALPREQPPGSRPRRSLPRRGIAFRGVSLTYPGASRPALREIDLDLPESGVVAIVGRNGSGKSTLLRILLGLRQDYTGRVEIGGHDLREFDLRWLRGRMGTVDQDTVLFSGTVRDNLDGKGRAGKGRAGKGRARNGRAGEDEVRAALSFAGALDFVEALPQGLDTELGENGRTLSGGQRQRLSIARAVLRDPVLALLDEPTAFLDPEAAQALERRLAGWGRDRLLLLVTHHLAAVRNADRIIVLDQGRLIGSGRHDRLVETVPTYAALWADYRRSVAEIGGPDAPRVTPVGSDARAEREQENAPS